MIVAKYYINPGIICQTSYYIMLYSNFLRELYLFQYPKYMLPLNIIFLEMMRQKHGRYTIEIGLAGQPVRLCCLPFVPFRYAFNTSKHDDRTVFCNSLLQDAFLQSSHTTYHRLRRGVRCKSALTQP